MKIETEKESRKQTFKDVKYGQCFRHNSGGFYIKIHEPSGSGDNCVNLDSGWPGVCCTNERVKIFEDAKVVLNG